MHYKFLKVPVTTLKPYAQTTPPLHPPPQKKRKYHDKIFAHI